MAWKVQLKRSVIDDLKWFGKATGRKLLALAQESLSRDPLVKSRNMKTLRPNAFADRELRLLGKYRILFRVDTENHEVLIIAVGEKHGQSLIVQGKEYTAHHENGPIK